MSERIVFEHVNEIHSTNDELAERVASGRLSALYCLSADNQSCGHGRQGRVWLNTDGALMMSICFPLTVPGDRWPLISIASALGVYDAVSEYLPKCRIKWPNDVMISSGSGEIKKLCGILSRIVSDPGGDFFAIIGIGVNVNCTKLPDGLMQPATSLRLELGREIEIEPLKKRIASCVLDRLDEQKQSLSSLLSEYSSRCVTLNNYVTATDLEGRIVAEGFAKRILPSGKLVIQTDSGESAPREIYVEANDVSIRTKCAKTPDP